MASLVSRGLVCSGAGGPRSGSCPSGGWDKCCSRWTGCEDDASASCIPNPGTGSEPCAASLFGNYSSRLPWGLSKMVSLLSLMLAWRVLPCRRRSFRWKYFWAWFANWILVFVFTYFWDVSFQFPRTSHLFQPNYEPPESRGENKNEVLYSNSRTKIGKKCPNDDISISRKSRGSRFNSWNGTSQPVGSCYSSKLIPTNLLLKIGNHLWCPHNFYIYIYIYTHGTVPKATS